MNSRSFIILGVAVAIGLGAMRLSQQLLASNRKGQEDTQEVVVAARDFKEEEILKPDMVKVIRMARSAIPPNSFSAAKDVEERWVRTTMLEGDVLVEKKLGPKGTPPGLVANIPPGMRALAIDVTEQSGVSGFILPGHHVDVVRFETSEKNDVRGETILQDVLVLAAGQLFSRPDERAVQSRTVTLALSPGDVQIIVAARARGALSLSLRGVNDHAMVEAKKAEPRIDPEALQRLKVAEDARQKAESDLQVLKEELARKRAEPKAAPPRAAPRTATIYRGINNRTTVVLDEPGVTRLAPDETSTNPETGVLGMQRGFGTGSLRSPNDETEP
jgi:pilus assembly protein CpaB